MKDKLKNIGTYLTIVLMIWFGVTQTIGALENEHRTQTENFYHMVYYFVLDFKHE